MLKEVLVIVVTTVVLGAAGCGTDAPTFTVFTPEEKEGQILKTREDVMALFDEADSWLEAKHGDAEFIFCENNLPAYGSSRIDVHAWVFRRHSKQWERMLSIRTNGVGNLELSVNSNTGIFSAKGSANNKFKNKAVFTFDLKATEI